MGCNQTIEGQKHVEENNSNLCYNKLPLNFNHVHLEEHEPKPVTSKTTFQSDYLLPVYGVKYDLYPFKSHQKQAGSESFYDSEFAGADSSLYSYQNQLRNKIDGCDWKRPHEYMDVKLHKIEVFEDDIEPNDIKQGNLSDCYFLSALSAIADHNPNLIRQLFVTPQLSEIGLYCVYLNIMGHWKQVCVDDRVPCFTDGGPIFSRCHGNELWVVLMEKVYAKSYQSYGNIESGYPGVAFRDLTGAPTDYLVPDNNETHHLDQDKAWLFIQEGLKMKYILTCSTEKSNSGVEIENNSGIISEHCYAMLDCQKVIDSQGQEDFIVKMRNPWGHKEWSGDWGDHSSKWTEKLKSQLNVEDKDDGIFWINKRDFVTQFNSVENIPYIKICVCKVHPEYLYSSYQITDGNQNEQITQRLLIMRVFKDTHGFITASQKDLRFHPRREFKYGLTRLIIAKIDINENKVLEFVDDKFEVERDVYCEGDFTQGYYLIYVETEWNGDWSREMVISGYTQNSIHFTEIESNKNYCDQVLDSIIQVHECRKANQSKNYGDQITKVSGFVGGYLYFDYKNLSIATTLNETVQMNSLINLKACLPQTVDEEFQVDLGPQNKKFIKYRVTIQGDGSFSYKTTVKYTLQQSYSNDQLIQQCKLSVEKTTQRKMKGEPIEVYFSIYTHTCGTAFLYQNKTDKTFSEELTLKLVNLAIKVPIIANHTESLPLKVVIPSKGQFLVSLNTVDSNIPSSYSMSMQFKLT